MVQPLMQKQDIYIVLSQEVLGGPNFFMSYFLRLAPTTSLFNSYKLVRGCEGILVGVGRSYPSSRVSY